MLEAAASQVWPAFVLGAGLLLVGSVVERDGLFAYAGAVVVLLIAVVTATLNLDTSVAFLTPVLVHTARSRG